MNNSNRIIIKPVFILFTIIISLINVACGQSKNDKFDKLISTYEEYGKFNGSVLVSKGGKIIYEKGFGYANMEWDIPNQPQTKHRLGSITKQFTAMLIVMLVSENKLDLNVPIINYLPDYPKKNGNVITIHQLLTHTSGIPNFTSFRNFYEKDRSSIKPAEFINYFSDSALLFKPGEKFDYSNSGYFLLGVIIEKVTGKPYDKVLQEKIFSPLKMSNTGYEHNGTILKNKADGYEKNGTGFIHANYIDMSIPYSAGALYSTVEDLFLWDQALYTETLLPKKYMDLIFDKYIPAFGKYYGYGWIIGDLNIGSTNDRLQTISHSGSINGFSSLITRIPKDTTLIVLLNNTGGAPLQDITSSIAGILYDKPYALPKKSVAFTLLDVIEKEGLAKALLIYKEIRNSSDYLLDEGEMNQAGYQLLQSNKAKEASEIFKLNVEAFSNSSNVYDSYGEALLVLGYKKLAIENYIKSVQLNPDNTSGTKILKEQGVNTDSLFNIAPVVR